MPLVATLGQGPEPAPGDACVAPARRLQRVSAEADGGPAGPSADFAEGRDRLNREGGANRRHAKGITRCVSACKICKQTLDCGNVNGKQRSTLAAIFRDPVSGTIEWAAVESLLVAVGCRIIEGSGSRVRFEKDGEMESFHRPHPAKEAKRYQVRAARAFLIRLGVET